MDFNEKAKLSDFDAMQKCRILMENRYAEYCESLSALRLDIGRLLHEKNLPERFQKPLVNSAEYAAENREEALYARTLKSVIAVLQNWDKASELKKAEGFQDMRTMMQNLDFQMQHLEGFHRQNQGIEAQIPHSRHLYKKRPTLSFTIPD